MISLIAAYMLYNATACYPNCTAHIIFVNTPYGSYTQTQQIEYIQQIRDADQWWIHVLQDTHMLTFTVDPILDAVSTDKDNDWLGERNSIMWNTNDLFIYVVYSPPYIADAWVFLNYMVVYVRDMRDIRYIFAHEFGHLLYNFPNIITDTGIMGANTAYAYTHNLLGTQLLNRLVPDQSHVYLPFVGSTE